MGEPQSDRRDAIERRLLLAVMEAAEKSPYPYDVRQAEFQTNEDRVAWVVQIADPIPPLAGTALPFDTLDVILRWPVRMYLEAVTPHLDKLGFVHTFLLAIRDEGPSVYELDAGLLAEWAAGGVTEDGVLNGMTITRLAG